MQNAPSVSYPVGRCAFVGWVLGAVSGLAVVLQAGVALDGWSNGGAWVPLRWGLSSGVWVVTLAWAWWHWWHSPAGWLIWEPSLEAEPPLGAAGQVGWWWGARSGPEGQVVARVRVMVFAQTWALLLVTLGGENRPRGLWVWAQAGEAPDRWPALRRALTRHAG